VTFQTQTCVVLVCDGGCDHAWDDEEGIPHFDSEVEALDFGLSRGWNFDGGRALCSRCHQLHLCDDTGHLWGDWRDEVLHTVEFRKRGCERCDRDDYDPPFGVLYPKFQALRDAEEVLRAVKP
jgi:hypothetical protein